MHVKYSRGRWPVSAISLFGAFVKWAGDLHSFNILRAMLMCLANWVQITNLDLNSTKPNAWLSELGLAERLKRKICKDCRTKLSSNKQAKYSSENNVLVSLLKL